VSDSVERRGFTKSYATLVNNLTTPVSIFPVSSRDNTLRNVPVKLKALWDTGAMKTCIKPKVRDILNLRMFRIGSAVTIAGVGGEVKADFTVLAIFLTGNMGIEHCPVYVLNFPGSADMIMDIISLGDFAVCNADGQTSFSFAMPPFPDRINFVDKINAQNKQHKQ
jgi:hypothetical protein